MKILVIGSLVLDEIIKIPSLPNKTQDINTNDLEFSIGGMAFNVYNVATLLGSEVILGCPIGNGIFANILKSLIKEYDITPIHQITNEDNGVCMCLVSDDGERTFISHHGAEYRFDETWFKDINFEEINYIYISGLEIEDKDGDKIIEFLKKQNKNIFFAIGPRINLIDKNKLNNIFKLKPILHLNESEATSFTNTDNYFDALKELYKIVNNIVIMTLGDKGACLYDGKEIYYEESFKTSVVDTIGAGDCHAGCMLHMLNNNENYQKSLEIANKISAKVVSIKGSHLKSKDLENIL